MYATTVKAAYSQSPHPLPSPISNREPFRLEIRVTHTKQSRTPILIGKITRFFQITIPSPSPEPANF